MNVLLVEDDDVLASVFQRNVKARGHAVRTAGTAEGACVQLHQKWPDVLILDVGLPDFSGWEVLRRLSQQERARLKVIVISAAPVSRKRIGEFKPACVLQKPFPMSSFLRAIESISRAAPKQAIEEGVEIS